MADPLQCGKFVFRMAKNYLKLPETLALNRCEKNTFHVFIPITKNERDACQMNINTAPWTKARGLYHESGLAG